jgi:phosphatidylinositol glycan class T
LEYTPSFLTIDDFPGDPNRGRVLPPSSVTVVCDPSTVPNGQSTKTVVYSNSLLLLPPVPDLSMPFNVISLTSSLYAYIVGAMITILVRKGSEKIKYTMHPDKKPESKLAKLKTKLRQKIGRVRAKLLGKEINDNSSTARENDSHEEPTTAPKNTSELSETLKRSSGDLTENKT